MTRGRETPDSPAPERSGAGPLAAATTDPDDLPLVIEGLEISVMSAEGPKPLVTDADLRLGRREVLGLVGESGSGKSLTCLAVARLLDRSVRVTGGSIRLFGRDLTEIPESEMRHVRGKDVGMIFQNPMTSLDPSFTIGYQLSAPLRRHTDLRKGQLRERTLELLNLVGIGDPRRRVDQYPHQLSGGMRQRVMIALAVSCEPRLLIADEPTTALDATTQAQILELIASLGQTLDMSTIITTHDLGVVAEVCDDVAVMYAGEVVENAGTDELFHHPKQPYTARLLQSLPRLRVDQPFGGIPGQPPRAGDFGAGCRFAPRCEHAQPRCTESPVELVPVSEDRRARCVRVDELELEGVHA